HTKQTTLPPPCLQPTRRRPRHLRKKSIIHIQLCQPQPLLERLRPTQQKRIRLPLLPRLAHHRRHILTHQPKITPLIRIHPVTRLPCQRRPTLWHLHKTRLPPSPHRILHPRPKPILCPHRIRIHIQRRHHRHRRQIHHRIPQHLLLPLP